MEPQTSQNNSILDKIETVQALSGYAAMGVVTPFRRRVGLRMTRGIFLYPVVATMAGIGYYASSSHYLAYYAAGVLACGLWQNHNRWKEMKQGDPTHTRSLGVSPLAAIPFTKFLPAKVTNWITSGDHIHRSLDPLVLFAAGLLIIPKDLALGGWIMFSAVALRIFEEFRQETSWNMLLDGVDSMLMGESQKAFMDHIRRGGTEPLTDPATGRQTTGAAEEMYERITRNKAEQAAAEAQAEQQAPPHPFTEATNRVNEAAGAFKEAAGAVKEAAEAVGAFREATAARETVIIATERTTREVVIVQPEYAAYRIVIPGPIPDGMSAQEWLLTYSVYPERFTFTPEQQAEILAAYDQRQLTGDTAPIVVQPPATPEPEKATERQWDVIEHRYRDRPAAEAESARQNAARETWELPVPPPGETNKAA